jgi:hypothetical protein
MKHPALSWHEQAWRRRAAELLRQGGLLRGNISMRRRLCGKATCRCVRGERHEGMYLVYRQANRTTQVYVPKAWQERVQEWVQRYGEVRELLRRLSGLYEAKVRHRRD